MGRIRIRIRILKYGSDPDPDTDLTVFPDFVKNTCAYAVFFHVKNNLFPKKKAECTGYPWKFKKSARKKIPPAKNCIQKQTLNV